MTNWPAPFTIEGQHVRLEPLSHTHHDDLCEATEDGQLYKLWYTAVPSAETMEKEIATRLSLQQKGNMLPFAVIGRETGRAIGMTTYLNLCEANRNVEIGATWYRKSAQRSPVNTECKLLLLSHAFEKLDCIAVNFRTHILNTSSRRAIERLGAKLDGILRNQKIMPNGTIRDTAAYSIIASEWPAVRANLTYLLSA